MTKGYWLNTTKVIDSDVEKPCKMLRYCPYGQLVEEFPLASPPTSLSCIPANGGLGRFGHDCPVHYHKEALCTTTK